MLVATLALAVVAAVTAGPTAATAMGQPELRVISSRADLVSGGDALIEIVSPGSALAHVEVTANGRDVSDRFVSRGDGRVVGLVSGLGPGPNELAVRAPDGREARLDVVNHPRSGPLFSGPQITPWICSEGAVNPACERPTTFDFFYVSSDPVEEETCEALPSTVTNRVPDDVEEAGAPAVNVITPPCYRPYDPSDPPSDVATVRTTDGEEVPHIVRLETGIMDRDEYRIAVLFDPAEPWDPFEPQRGWNRKLVIKHGSSCGADFAEGVAPDVMDEGRALSRGFAVMSTALNNSGHNCHVVLQAESMLMAKEHLVETYGELRYTIGKGGSGGALAQQWVANAYPGVYDGILLSQSFPDGWSTLQEIEDCNLLLGYWLDPARWGPGVAWSPQQMAAVSGHQSVSVCHSWVTVYDYPALLDPTQGRSCDVPGAQRYHADDRPDGVRCALQDYTVGVLGERVVDGFAHRPYDNVGVQYGLEALRAGVITPAMFADLNAKVGGRDIDGVWQDRRAEAEIVGVERAYRSGLVNEGNNMEGVAIIDLRGTNSAELHHHVRTHTMRARLDRSNGHHDNHLSWWGPIATSGDTSFSSAAFDLMDEWLAAVEADGSDRPLAEKVVAAKPAGAVDRCTDGRGDPAPAETCQLPDATPRLVAGFPVTDDVVKCELRDLDPDDDYGLLPLTDADRQLLAAAFPTGVCDVTVPGQGQQRTLPWLDYSAGPGGVPLGPTTTGAADGTAVAGGAGASATTAAHARFARPVRAPHVRAPQMNRPRGLPRSREGPAPSVAKRPSWR